MTYFLKMWKVIKGWCTAPIPDWEVRAEYERLAEKHAKREAGARIIMLERRLDELERELLLKGVIE